MKKIICLTVIVTLLTVCLSSCSGYNKIMREHLSEPENYLAFEVVLNDMYYQDPSTHEIVRNFENSEFLDHDITFSVTFETIEDVSKFSGGTPDPDTPPEDYKFTLCITADNNKILYSNGFYDSVSLGDKIGITSSNFVYMDSDFFYIAQVEHDGTVYLSFEEGLKNIVDMMDKDKSLF